MGTTQSHNLSAPPAQASAENENMLALNANKTESDDEFTDCTDEIAKLTADINDDVNFEENSKPLGSSSKCEDLGSQSQTKGAVGNKQIESDDDDESFEERKERQKKEMDEFREEMNKKREVRQQCIKRLREELIDLRGKLSSEMESNEQLRDALESKCGAKSFEDLVDENKKLKADLAECQLFLQTSNSENINSTFENQALRDQVRSLKEVISAVKEMLAIREAQVDQMKSKLTEIESSFAERETKIMSTKLQQEYQRQLENIRNMRELYEERANILTQEKNALKRKLDEKDLDLKTEIEKSKNLEEYISTLEDNVKLKNSDIGHLESEINMLKAEKAQVASEMSAVNQLIAQVLFGFSANGSRIDIDKLVSMLEQNRDFLNEMAIKEDYEGIDEGSFLPKMLYDLFVQANQNQESSEGGEEKSESPKDHRNTPEEIAEKLPKVWRVLIELLSHHKKLSDEEEERVVDCYKSVQTAAGTQNVLSVSKTFIKLKDLILEKRSLQKDTTRLKTLYSHLEQRLDKQEKRLSNVSLELTKTWHLVGKIKRQNRQLHTHEQILCYQLQQKRRLLNELKAELEYCRKKWALARALNNESEEQCKQLRHEFSMRKIQDQNSGESGYSDEQPSDDDERVALKRLSNVERFDQNLVMFDRTASPMYTERRQTLTMIRDFSNMSLFSRAQSEPPRIAAAALDDESNQTEMETVLELIPDPTQETCVALSAEEPNSRTEESIVAPSLGVQVFSPPKLKAQMRKHKTKKLDKSKAETAEEMFLRLMSINKEECSTCSSTTNSIDCEDVDCENVEKIQELPLDDDPVQDALKVPEVGIEADQEVSSTATSQETAEVGDNSALQPSASTTGDDIECLTTKEQDFIQRREARLARLEAEAKAFYDRMAKNKDKGQQLDNHLNDIHQTFLERNRERNKSEEAGKEASNDEPSTSGESEKKSNEAQKENKNDEK